MSKKAQKIVITKDSDGDDVVWNLHRDLTMTRNAMPPMWVSGVDIPVVDLRSGDYIEHAPSEFQEEPS
jgi:hypothetical protein